MKQHNLVVFNEDDFTLDVQVENETVWLSQNQMADLFDRDSTVIKRHINNIYKENELDKEATSAKNAEVRIEGGRSVTRSVEYYGLDVIISVGYRVKSKRGTKFRQWANKLLKEYLVDGYVVNISKLEKENLKLKELQNMISIVHRVAIESDVNKDEIMGLLSVIKDYEFALDLLDRYDHKTVSIGEVSIRTVNVVRIDEVYNIVKTMSEDFSTDLFGKERDESLSSSLNAIYQSAFGEDVYPSLEEKASNLLYFLVKNHSFVDGNKRIAAATFIYFLKKNDLYYSETGNKRLTDATLVSLTLLIAQSNPREKEILVKILVNLLLETEKNSM